jgi:hypothetical protein
VEETNRFLFDAPDSHEYLPIKVASVLSYYGLLRRVELVALTFENIKFEDGQTCSVYFTRGKQQGAQEHESFIVNGPKCLEILRSYYSCFTDKDRTGRLLRYLTPQKTAKFKMSYKLEPFGNGAEHLKTKSQLHCRFAHPHTANHCTKKGVH